eukprot:7253111-Alexandrium_andersonii.AAC.1
MNKAALDKNGIRDAMPLLKALIQVCPNLAATKKITNQALEDVRLNSKAWKLNDAEIPDWLN